MEQSILKSTKKMLGIDASFTVFDTDIITHINSAFSSLNQLGVGPSTSFNINVEQGPALVFSIEDDTAVWEDLGLSETILNMVKPYVYLKVRMIFDPPSTSFAIEAGNKQLQEFEWRLNSFREKDRVLPSNNQEEEVV